uniref:Regulator of G-protein signaling loco n=1 Tax=Timema monikensis TaxID=170555 RepID=A0A7R9HTI7_9NEOP|nr:unnamed protein product [Timema monikensis]
MHPIRRRKKRPNYGIRTVEVSRGKNGFGFTISGQQPCILSCIVAGSPAEKAGLRPGDYLVAVNSQSVSKVPHDDVVRMIGGSSGILNLQIAENYYSDSSDEDVMLPTRPKPRYIHKPRQHHRGTTTQQSRAAKVVRDLRTGAMFEEQQREAVTLPTVTTTRVACKSTPPLPQRWEPAPVPPPRIYPPPQGKVDSVEYRAIVGYLGTIEMPRELQPGSRLQVVRGCIKRLRAEKRAHTLVLMSVGTRSLVLTNCNQSILAEYPADRVTFCGSSSYDEQKYFGLVTSANVDTDDSGESVPSSSCHVFAVEPSLHGSHSQHSVKADTFKLCCSVDPVSGLCREFPESSESVILAVRTLYVGREGSTQEEHLVANSPQPSNAGSTATTTSSNSDSGIGFRDDCGGNQSDSMADSIVAAGTVLPNTACNLLPGPSQGRNIDKRRKRVRPSSPTLGKIQEVVRPQPRFLVMSRVEEYEDLKRVSPFILERVINGAAKSEVSKKKLRDGTIMIQTINDIRSSRVMAISEIPLSNTTYIPVNVEPHRFLNICKGVVTCYDLDCVSIEDICEELSPQHVTEVYRIVTKKNGQEKNTDTILVVDVRNQRLHIQTECQHADRRLTVRAMPDPVVSSRSRSPLSGSSSDDRAINKRKTKPRLEPYPERAVDYDYTSMVTQSNDNMSISSENNKSQDAMDAMSVHSCQSQDPLLSYKLSPKVFGVPHPVTHSLEDLKGAEGPTQHTAVNEFKQLNCLSPFPPPNTRGIVYLDDFLFYGPCATKLEHAPELLQTLGFTINADKPSKEATQILNGHQPCSLHWKHKTEPSSYAKGLLRIAGHFLWAMAAASSRHNGSTSRDLPPTAMDWPRDSFALGEGSSNNLLVIEE